MELKTKTVVFITVGFVLGGIAGGYVGKQYFASERSERRPSRAEFQKMFAERLRLDSLQVALVDSIVEHHRQKFDTLQREYSARFREKRDTLRIEISKVLTPEQNELYQEFIKEQEKRESRRHGRRDR